MTAPLRHIRERLGLTQEALAARLGLTRGAVAKMERRTDIDARTGLALAAIEAGLEPLQ